MDVLAQQIAAGGTVGLILALLVALWAFSTGRIRVGSLVDKEKAEEAARRDKVEEKLSTDAKEWRTIGESAMTKLGRLTDVLEATVGKKLGE